MSSGLYFSRCHKVDCVGFSKLFHLRDLFRNLPFTQFFAMNVIALGFSRLFHRSSLLCDPPFSSVLIHVSFASEKVHATALVLPRLAHWTSLPFASTHFYRDEIQTPRKSCKSVFDVSSIQTGVNLRPTLLRTRKNPCLTHQQSIARCARNLSGLSNIDAIKRPININSVGSGNVSHAGGPAFDDQFDHSFIVSENCKRHSHAGNVCGRCHKIEITK